MGGVVLDRRGLVGRAGREMSFWRGKGEERGLGGLVKGAAWVGRSGLYWRKRGEDVGGKV